MLTAVVAATERAVANNPLRRILAFLELTLDLLRRPASERHRQMQRAVSRNRVVLQCSRGSAQVLPGVNQPKFLRG